MACKFSCTFIHKYKNMDIAEVLIPMTFFASMFGFAYIFFSTRHRERMALIEKGANPDIFRNPNKPRSTLKFGLLFVGISLGILTGTLLTNTVPGMREETANFSMIFLFGGLALILNHVLEAKKVDDRGPNNETSK
jgi:hypothetical protein